MEDVFPKKHYCYKSECSITLAGFHLEQYYVCKHCKLEVSESLFKSIEQGKKNKKELEDQMDLWDTL